MLFKNHALGIDKILDNPKMVESHFRECLRIFCLNETLPEKERSDVAYHYWIRIASSPFIPIDVVDDETLEVKFTAPPLKYRPVQNGTDYCTIMKKADALKASRPQTAHKMVYYALADFFDGKDDIPEADSKKWQELKELYGFDKHVPDNTNYGELEVSVKTLDNKKEEEADSFIPEEDEDLEL